MRQSVPINQRGDRLMVPGEPGAIEKLVRAREAESAAIAAERVVGYLEGIDGLLDAISDQQQEHLVALIRSLCHGTAIEYHAKLLQIYAEARRYVPTYDCVPDYRDPGPGFLPGSAPDPDEVQATAPPNVSTQGSANGHAAREQSCEPLAGGQGCEPSRAAR